MTNREYVEALARLDDGGKRLPYVRPTDLNVRRQPLEAQRAPLDAWATAVARGYIVR